MTAIYNIAFLIVKPDIENLVDMNILLPNLGQRLVYILSVVNDGAN